MACCCFLARNAPPLRGYPRPLRCSGQSFATRGETRIAGRTVDFERVAKSQFQEQLGLDGSSGMHASRRDNIVPNNVSGRDPAKAPTVGLEPTTTRLRALRSTD